MTPMQELIKELKYAVKKCKCENPKQSPTYINECMKCNGEIYSDYTNKIRWNSLTL